MLSSSTAPETLLLPPVARGFELEDVMEVGREREGEMEGDDEGDDEGGGDEEG